MRSLPDIGDTFGDYRIEGVLGSGGMGYVYAAVRLRLTRVEALKVLPPHFWDSAEYRARFIREATTLSQLDSPHIVHIYDYGEHDGCPYLSTQLIRDGDLQALLQSGPLPAETAVLIARQIASALEDAHSAGVVHRDVKPSNVLVKRGAEPYAYLCDFGIARTDDRGLTTSGAVVGTWAYLAPECCQGRPASPRSDVYSLGCLLWAMLTGEAPYQGSGVEVAMRHLHEPIPQLAGEDEGTTRLNGVLRRAMAKDPDDRFPSVQDMSTDLLRAGAVRRDPPPDPPEAEGRRDETIRRPPIAVSRTPAQASQSPARRVSSTEHERRRGRAAALAIAAVLVAALLGVGIALLLTGPDGDLAAPHATPTANAASPPSRRELAARQLRLTRASYDNSDYSGVAIQTRGSPGLIATFVSDGKQLTRRQQVIGVKPAPDEHPHRLNGDFDGDGYTDVALVEDAGNHQDVVVRRGGKGGFGPPRTWGRMKGSEPTASMSGDFDGNGHMDLLHQIGERKLPISFSVLLSTRDGAKPGTAYHFKRGSRWASDLPWRFGIESLVAGDFNADGNTDVAGLSGIQEPNASGTCPIQVVLSTKSAFTAPRPWGQFVLPAGSDPAHTKQLAGDFNGDGTTDLALYVPMGEEGADGAELLVALEKGGRFTQTARPWWRTDAPMTGDRWLSVGDFDAGRRDDLAEITNASEGGLDIDVLRSRGTSFQAPRRWGHWYTRLGTSDVFTVNRVG